MSEPGNHRAEEPELRPRPARPEFVVEPLRPRQEPTGTGVAVRAAVWAWVAVAVVMVGLGAVAGLEYRSLRSVLEATVARDGSGATASEIADTVTVTLLGSAAVAIVLLLLAGLGLALASSRRSLSGTLLLIVGLATVGAFVLFWSFMSGAGAIAGGVLQWGALVGAGIATAATLAAAFVLARK